MLADVKAFARLAECVGLHAFGQQEALVAIVEGGVARLWYLHSDKRLAVFDFEALKIDPLCAAGDCCGQSHLVIIHDHVFQFCLCQVAG